MIGFELKALIVILLLVSVVINFMTLIEKIEEYFVKRNLKRRMIIPRGTESEIEFQKVLNTLRENRIVVDTRKDGVYIRFAGDRDNMINSDYFVKVVDFRDNKLKKLGI